MTKSHPHITLAANLALGFGATYAIYRWPQICTLIAVSLVAYLTICFLIVAFVSIAKDSNAH